MEWKDILGDSVEVLTAKIFNIKQNNKIANAYCNEIELLAKSLETSYISDGLTNELATKYSTNVAIKALTKNCTIDKVKLIMEAAQFNNMNEAISKFINSWTEASGQQNAILFYKQRNNNNNSNNYRRSYQNFRGKKKCPRDMNRSNNNNNNTN